MANSTPACTWMMQLAAISNKIALLLSQEQATQQWWHSNSSFSSTDSASLLNPPTDASINTTSLMVQYSIKMLQLYSLTSQVDQTPSSTDPPVKQEQVEISSDDPSSPSRHPSHPRGEEASESDANGQEMALLRSVKYIASRARPRRFTIREVQRIGEKMGVRTGVDGEKWMNILRQHGLQQCIRLRD